MQQNYPSAEGRCQSIFPSSNSVMFMQCGKVSKPQHAYQIPSLLGPENMIFFTRRWQLYMRNTDWGILPSLSPACWATLGTSLYRLCSSVLTFASAVKTTVWNDLRDTSYCSSGLAKKNWGGDVGGEGRASFFFRNLAVTAEDFSNYCLLFSTPFLKTCCFWSEDKLHSLVI